MKRTKLDPKMIAVIGGIVVVALILVVALSQGGNLAGTAGAKKATATPVPPQPTATQAQGGNVIAKSVRLDPALAQDADSAQVNGYLYETLFRMENGKVVPGLALSWEISEDQLTYTLVLRYKVTFHDGTPFNADAVLANFNRWFDPENPLHGTASYPIWEKYFLGYKGDLLDNKQPKGLFDGAEKVNDITVLIHLNRVDPNFITYLTDPAFSMASPTALAKYGANYGLQAGGAAGTGPYSLSAWTNDALELKANSGYWGTVPTTGIKFTWK